MNKSRRLLEKVARIILWTVLALFVLLLLGILGFPINYIEVPFRLVAGFVFFLARNIPAISTNADTWVPGVAAFLIAIFAGHLFLKSWAHKRQREWSFKSTVCLGLILPVLFGIAFIVPGVILQAGLLTKDDWFTTNRHMEAPMRMAVRNCALACQDSADQTSDGRFPDSLEAIEKKEKAYFERFTGRDFPYEPFIYLGSGLTLSSDASLPLCISPPFRNGSDKFRILITIGCETIKIRDDEVDSWIDRVLPQAGKAAQ